MKFLRNLIASILGTLVGLALLLMLFVAIAVAQQDRDSVEIPETAVLQLSLKTQIKDYAPKSDDVLDELFGYNKAFMGLNAIENAIENAKTDPRIKGISLKLRGGAAGVSQTQAIRRKLKEFKSSGKFIYAYADQYDQKSYYLSSVADSVFVNPFGGVDFKGLSGEVLYLKKLQEKTGVKMEVIRHGKYKSAVEPFLSDRMSDANREQITSFIGAIWEEIVNEIAESRAIPQTTLNDIADNLLGRNSELSLANKLVDGTIYADIYEQKLKQAMDLEEDATLKAVSLSDYISTGKGRLPSTASDKIAVVYAQGEIVYGKGDENVVGHELIIKALKKVRKSKSVKAVVLRINSPGGSALASELMWRELELTAAEKPLVVSLGDVAASGGYYMACNADKIIAEASSITGSIGVFGVIPNISELADNIGVNAEQVSTNKGADYSVFEPMTEAFRSVTTEGVERVYYTFLDRVAEGRSMSVEEVDKVAQGRVWSGREAMEHGLVDDIGGLEDAVKHAAELVESTDYRVVNYPRYKKNLDERLASFPFGQMKEKILKEELGEVQYGLYKNTQKITRLFGIQARMPFNIAID